MGTLVATIIGRISTKPELKYLPDGTTAVTQIRIPCETGYLNKKNGKDTSVTTWVTIDFIGTEAENIAQYRNKGDVVSVTGKLEVTQWESNGRSGIRAQLKNPSRLENYTTRAEAELRGHDTPAADTNDDSDPFGDE